MTRRIRITLFASLVLFLMAMSATFLFITSRNSPRAPLPNPNGYDDFIKAGAMLVGRSADYADLDEDGLRDLLKANAEALRLIRDGLALPCAMPTDFMSMNPNLPRLMDMKALAQLFVAEGRLAELENRTADAARSYTDAIRFGNEISRGGYMMIRLAGIACESIGCRRLARIVPQLNRQDSQTILLELNKIDANRVTWGEVMQNEKTFMRRHRQIPWNPIEWGADGREARDAIQRSEKKQKRIVAIERLAAVELALRVYQFDQGHPPEGLDSLVTNYLCKVPQDPFADQPLIYRPQGTNWLLYSVGSDGADDGRKPASIGSPLKGGIRYDSGWGE